jgi:hypothetical protein
MEREDCLIDVFLRLQKMRFSCTDSRRWTRQISCCPIEQLVDLLSISDDHSFEQYAHDLMVAGI